MYRSKLQAPNIVTVVGRENGVRLMRIFFPGTYYVAKAGGYDGKQPTNCTIRKYRLRTGGGPAYRSEFIRCLFA